jgi:hypothetical protein
MLGRSWWRQQAVTTLVLSLAVWNRRDPILKERMFGLTNSEGNHGEDVKEIYYYLDATPTNSYLKMLYKYPQRSFHARLAEEPPQEPLRSGFELLDTGVFDDSRYWDVFVEYGKASPQDILMQITVANRGPISRNPRPAAAFLPQYLVLGLRHAQAFDESRGPSCGRASRSLASTNSTSKATPSSCSTTGTCAGYLARNGVAIPKTRSTSAWCMAIALR